MRPNTDIRATYGKKGIKNVLVLGKVDEKATQLHAIASLKVLLDATKPQDGVNGTTNPADGTITGVGDMAHDSGRASQGTEVTRTLRTPLSSVVAFSKDAQLNPENLYTWSRSYRRS